MKKVKLTEKQLEDMVLKVLEEQGAVQGASAGLGRSEMNRLPKCYRKDSKELIGGVIKDHMVFITDPKMKAFQVAANKAGTGTELYLEVKGKPFCKIR